MREPWTSGRACVLALGLVALAMFASCSAGDNETPASFDPKELALVRVEPQNGESAVARNIVVRFIFNTTVLPSSVNDQSLRIRTGGTFQTRPEGTFLITANEVLFEPAVTETGGANAGGFPAGAQILCEVPLLIAGDGEPANNFLQNIEGNPITISSAGATSASTLIAFTTGSGWNDPVPGPPGVLGIDFTPSPNALGQVPSSAAVTVIFSEAIDPGSLVLGKNIFLTNNTDTSPIFQQDIPSVTFFDGSLTRFTFLPVFGFGQGPFNVKVNFIDPDRPDTFTPVGLPRDLGGNRVQNFTFLATFDTQFDPNTVNTGLLREDFTTFLQRDPSGTDATWGDDAEFPFALTSQIITNRTQNVTINAITTISGGSSVIDNPPLGAPGLGEEDYCPTFNPLVGPDASPFLQAGAPPTSAGRRQMNLYRQAEMGGNGTITRVAWGPDSDATFAATYRDVFVRIGHKRKDTSFASGALSLQFDVNGFVLVVNNVVYSVPQALDINGGPINNGFLNWPTLTTFFDFTGNDDLILDVEAQEGNTFQTFRTYLSLGQLSGGFTCTCFQFAGCTLTNSIGNRQADGIHGGDSFDPPTSPVTSNPGPFVHVMQFELAKLRSDARSLYYDTLTPTPDYLAPIINPLVQDGGATVTFSWSASADGIVEDVPFSANINACDGFQFLRFGALLRANIFTSARARVELIEVPFTFE